MITTSFLLPFLFATGFFAGTIDAIAGGGGLITVPVLLSVGIPPHIALGTNKLQSVFGTAMATYSYYKNGLLELKKLRIGLLCTLIGAISGAVLTQVISSDILKKIIPILLFLILLYTIFSPKLGLQKTEPKMNENLFYLIFGTLLGFYDGFFGPGAGSLWAFSLVFLLGFNLISATAFSKVFNLNSNMCSLACFIIGANVDYKIGFCMAAGQIFGGRFGAALAIKKGAVLIRPVFLVVVTGTIATLIYKNLSEFPHLLQTPIIAQALSFVSKKPV